MKPINKSITPPRLGPDAKRNVARRKARRLAAQARLRALIELNQQTTEKTNG